MSLQFVNKTLLISGGTGSFGNAVLKGFLDSDFKEIRIFSRDEKKQDDMRKRYNSAKLKFYIGDVRNQRSVAAAMRGVDYVFHAAALKQVPSCEFHPMEAVKTKAVRKIVNQLCWDIRPDAVALVNAFDIPESCLAAPIAV